MIHKEHGSAFITAVMSSTQDLGENKTKNRVSSEGGVKTQKARGFVLL